MDTPSYGSPVRAYVNNQYSMRVSHDDDQSDPKDLSSLGVVTWICQFRRMHLVFGPLI